MRGRGKQSSNSFLAVLPSGLVSDTRAAGMGAAALESATVLKMRDLYSQTALHKQLSEAAAVAIH